MELRDNDTEDQVSLYLEGCDGTGAEWEFALPTGGWRRLLALGRMYGWHPAGTEAPDEDVLEEDDLSSLGDLSDWDGRYFPGYCQHVNVNDARALGAALVRALPDLPDHEAFERVPEDNVGRDSSSKYGRWHKVNSRTTPFQLYSGREKHEVLRGFITHCLECAGGFWIWSWEDR